MVTHSVAMLEKHLVFPGETPPRNFTTNKVKKRSMKPEDPMSHRIIEKRRRDRMNNCLADLSRLIPPEYLKKGRGRIEKTEIIEMAIKHMRHLQSIIVSSRFNGNSDNSVPSPPPTSTAPRDVPPVVDQPIIIEQYRLGYLECLSEAMHFLVEVQGYFAGDSLCVQMINHLHKHCDKILKGNTLNFPRKHTGETASSESSTSPANGTYTNSPPLAMSNSTGSASDDNQPVQSFESSARQFEEGPRNIQGGYRSPKRYAETCYQKRDSEGSFPRYGEMNGVDAENRYDPDVRQSFALKCRNGEIRKEEIKPYLNNVEPPPNFPHRNYSNLEDSLNYENGSLKEEAGSSPSQLREMLTSPLSICAHVNGHSGETKGSTSPLSNTSGCDASSVYQNGSKQSFSAPSPTKSLNFKSQNSIADPNEVNQDFSEGSPPDNHHMMYKFKNNIKQRFSKEKRESLESEDTPLKKTKPNDDYQRYPDPLMRERLNLLDRTEVDEEKVFKFNADLEMKKRHRYGSESEIQDGDIANRLSFGHKGNDRIRKWDDVTSGFQYHHHPKLWHLSPNGSLFNSQTPLGCKPAFKGLLTCPEYSSTVSNSFHNLSITASESTPGIPIFALHAKGSFYIPLTLDHATLAPFLTVLGITKADEGVGEEKTVLHPVTISVNFQSPAVR